MKYLAWNGFVGGYWQDMIDVSSFIINNYQPYYGDESFLAKPTTRTQNLNNKFQELLKQEQKNGGVLSIDTNTTMTITSHGAGYLDKENEIIVGLQTTKPLERGVNPFGGIKMARKACASYGYELGQSIEKEFRYRKTHNDGVFDAYNQEIKLARHNHIITGLPDAYGRGRIIGDYRLVPLYGVDRLIKSKKEFLDFYDGDWDYHDPSRIQLREEVAEQIRALYDLKDMAEYYHYDISLPAYTFKEAVQWLYFAYLAAIKQQNGAAMSLGRVSTFLDIYAERDLKAGRCTEEEIQEIIDDFVLKLRMARHLRTPQYNELFAGDPMWITEAIGGMTLQGRTLVTKNSYRFLHTLYNLGPSAEPNLTVLWADDLPGNFKRYCAKVSCDTAAIQYENDDLMRVTQASDDYGIACCVSAMNIGKEMQFFGARANLAKLLLYALNGGRDEITGDQVAPEAPVYQDEYLDYNKVIALFYGYQEWLANLYVKTMNIIHYMHDKYAYESLQMALHIEWVGRNMAFGIAGFSVLIDSLSAIKYARVKPIKDERGLIVDFEVEGDFPKFGNDDDRVDQIAQEIARNFFYDLTKSETYRDATHTLSILTITSNVVYGKHTGATPDGRKAGEPFAPGANPMHNRDTNGALASLNSVAKLPYKYCRDGISNTFSIVPKALGATEGDIYHNLSSILDGYFKQGGHHLNVNVFNREKLIDAMNNPEAYPNLTIRVSGYAVNFHKLSRAQQQEVINRTFHEELI